jgi:hypothetical protein
MPYSTGYECGECHHRFRVPEGAVRDTRLLMCPACGSIDLNLVTVERPPAVTWTSRAGIPSKGTTEDREKIAS